MSDESESYRQAIGTYPCTYEGIKRALSEVTRRNFIAQFICTKRRWRCSVRNDYALTYEGRNIHTQLQFTSKDRARVQAFTRETKARYICALIGVPPEYVSPIDATELGPRDVAVEARKRRDAVEDRLQAKLTAAAIPHEDRTYGGYTPRQISHILAFMLGVQEGRTPSDVDRERIYQRLKLSLIRNRTLGQALADYGYIDEMYVKSKCLPWTMINSDVNLGYTTRQGCRRVRQRCDLQIPKEGEDDHE